mmetsp:Transcript_21390/g.45121  ORF Transcript_21390/g.45121 Transcript_21390/m.45121 type:complete len:211 (-) Transcript_21390:911-1543(-)
MVRMQAHAYFSTNQSAQLRTTVPECGTDARARVRRRSKFKTQLSRARRARAAGLRKMMGGEGASAACPRGRLSSRGRVEGLEVAVVLLVAQLAQRARLDLPHALLWDLEDKPNLLDAPPVAAFYAVPEAEDLSLERQQRREERAVDLLLQQRRLQLDLWPGNVVRDHLKPQLLVLRRRGAHKRRRLERDELARRVDRQPQLCLGDAEHRR